MRTQERWHSCCPQHILCYTLNWIHCKCHEHFWFNQHKYEGTEIGTVECIYICGKYVLGYKLGTLVVTVVHVFRSTRGGTGKGKTQGCALNIEWVNGMPREKMVNTGSFKQHVIIHSMAYARGAFHNNIPSIFISIQFDLLSHIHISKYRSNTKSITLVLIWSKN